MITLTPMYTPLAGAIISGASAQPVPTMSTARTPATSRPQAEGAGLLGLLLSASVLAALVTSGINLWLARRKGRDEERARIRNLCAAAYQAYSDYKEFPYAIRRRNAAMLAQERVRLSEALQSVQSRLSYFEMWTMLEDPRVGGAYAELVRQARTVAGVAMHNAWSEDGVEDDSSMNIPAELVDMAPLRPHEQAYRTAVAEHLHRLAPHWS